MRMEAFGIVTGYDQYIYASFALDSPEASSYDLSIPTELKHCSSSSLLAQQLHVLLDVVSSEI
jgi:hypothetical protein